MKKLLIILIALCMSLITVGSAAAQDAAELQLSLSRDFGYGGFGNDIQGLFTMKIKDPPTSLASVDFMIDGEVVYHDTEAPFSFQFTTDSYPLGTHTLSATGLTTDGQALNSNEIVVDFVPASEGTKAIRSILIPLVGLIVVIMLVTFIIPVMLMRRKGQTLPLGAPRKYGISGGTICPKCKRPFGIHTMAPNVFVGKYDICPHCGKWSVVRPYPRNVLDAAVEAELDQVKSQETRPSESDEEKLRKEIEDSKFHDI